MSWLLPGFLLRAASADPSVFVAKELAADDAYRWKQLPELGMPPAAAVLMAASRDRAVRCASAPPHRLSSPPVRTA